MAVVCFVSLPENRLDFMDSSLDLQDTNNIYTDKYGKEKDF